VTTHAYASRRRGEEETINFISVMKSSLTVDLQLGQWKEGPK